MMRNFSMIVVLFVVVIGILGNYSCGSPPACTPGDTKSCLCIDSSKGVQTCHTSGTRWETCQCLPVGNNEPSGQESPSSTDTATQDSGGEEPTGGVESTEKTTDGSSNDHVAFDDHVTSDETVHLDRLPDDSVGPENPQETVGPEISSDTQPEQNKNCTPACNSCQLCSEGTCLPKADGLSCEDDQNPCTSDICQSGVCQHVAKADGFACTDDQNPCTSDVCQNGICVHPNNADGFVCGNNKVCKGGQCGDQDPCLGVNCQGHGKCSQGKCTCDKGYTGASCDKCDTGFVGFPNCVACGQKGQPCCENNQCQASSSLSCVRSVCQCTLCQPGAEQCVSAGSQQCATDGCSWQTAVPCPCGCSKGKCIPCSGTLVSGLGLVRSIAVDATHIYWVEYDQSKSNSGLLRRSDLLGQQVTDLIKNLGPPSVVVLDNLYAYTVENANASSRLLKVDKTLGNISVLHNALMNPFGLAIDATYAYVSSGNVPVRVPLAGGNSQSLSSSLLCGGNYPVGVDNQNIYITCRGTYDSATDTWSNGEIYKVPKSGGTESKITGVAGRPSDIVESGGFLYWREYTNPSKKTGSIRRMPTTGGTISDLATGLDLPAAFAVSGGMVYWIESTGDVRKVSITGGSVQTIIQLTQNPRAIAVDAKFVYWAAVPSGVNTFSIQRALK